MGDALREPVRSRPEWQSQQRQQDALSAGPRVHPREYVSGSDEPTREGVPNLPGRDVGGKGSGTCATDTLPIEGHEGVRPTEIYDRSRGDIDRHGAYILASYLAA